MMIYLSIFIVATVIASDCTWNYDNCEQWGDIVSDSFCGEQYHMQSPINIDTSWVYACSEDESKLEWTLNEEISHFEISNNGHSVDIEFIYDNGSSDDSDSEEGSVPNNIFGEFENKFMTDSGEHSKYCLHGAHLHWGATDEEGSEHLIDNHAYAMEMHFVHFSCDYKDLEEALAAEPTDPYVLAVIGVFFTVDGENEFIQEIVDSAKDVADYDAEMMISGVNIRQLFTIKEIGNFYHYKGSLTTPPCTPVVSWYVLEEPVTISESQLNTLRASIYNDCGSLMAPNFRPLQECENPKYYCEASKNDESSDDD